MSPEPHPLNRDFVWTAPRGPFRRITEQQARDFDEQGFCVVEDALSPELVRAVIAEIDVAIFAFDSAQRLALVNKYGERLLGQAGDTLVGLMDGAYPRGTEVFLGQQIVLDGIEDHVEADNVPEFFVGKLLQCLHDH